MVSKIIASLALAMVFAALSSAVAQPVEKTVYDGDMSRIQGDQQYIADLVYGIQDNLTALQRSGVGNSDTVVSLNLTGNGTVVGFNPQKGVKYEVNARDFTWTVPNITASTGSVTEDAAASTGSKVGSNHITSAQQPALLERQPSPDQETQALTYEQSLDNWATSAQVGEKIEARGHTVLENGKESFVANNNESAIGFLIVDPDGVIRFHTK